MYQFFVEPSQIQGNRIVITGSDVNHIKNVLRMKPGEEIAVSNGTDGKEYRCGIEELLEEEIICTLRFIKEDGLELPARVTFFQGLPKADKMEFIVQKLVELGAYRIVPVALKRSVVHLDEKKAKARQARWQSIAEAAAKQSKRRIVPEVGAVCTLKEALEQTLYEVMEGKPVTIRFLDPPLHEFVPTDEKDIEALAKDMNLSVEEVKSTCSELHEFNPMMGHRGCRLSVTYPEIARMQTRAVIEAAIEVSKEKGFEIVPEIMVPLVGDKKELKFVKDVIVETAEKVKAEKNSNLVYHIGTMIEIPRAALLANEIAEEAEFFSFGTNDLTQMTFGFSRDDAGKFLVDYYKSKIYESDPFAKLDQNGVGQLIEMAVTKGRSQRPNLKIGICGEHGGDPSSVAFCHKVGMDYVSCSPFRVPIARLAAAQAAIANAGK